MQDPIKAAEVTEAAVKTSPITPDQIAEAEAILAAAKQQPAINEQVIEDPAKTVDGIDENKKQELEAKFQDLINTPRFWENPNRIKRLEEALVLPMFDDRSKQQFSISAKEELLAKEMQAAIEQNRPPVTGGGSCRLRSQRYERI